MSSPASNAATCVIHQAASSLERVKYYTSGPQTTQLFTVSIMPPKRRSGASSSRGTRSSTRSQSAARAAPEEVYDVLTVPDSPFASGPASRGSSVVVTGERVAANRLRPKGERTRGGVTPKRSRRRSRQTMPEEGVLDVYRDMLREVVGTSEKQPEEVSDSEESRPPKRRKAVGDSNEAGPSSGRDKGKGILIEDTEDDAEPAIEDNDNEKNEDFEEEPEESSNESEADWEEVDLSKQRPSSIITSSLRVLANGSTSNHKFHRTTKSQ